MFRTTERGRELLADPPKRITVAYLDRYSEHVAFRGRRKDATSDDEVEHLDLEAVALEGIAPEARVEQVYLEDAKASDGIPSAAPPAGTLAAPGQRRRLTVSEAAYQVLSQASEPLHSNEIAERILAQGLWSTRGKTPGAAVDAQIAVDIKANGAAARFRRVGCSTFTVNGNGAAVPDDKRISPEPSGRPPGELWPDRAR